MRPLFIGMSLAWILSTFLFSFRLMVNAPVFFILFLIPPVLFLIYGLWAGEPLPATVLETGGIPPGRTDDGTYLPPETVSRFPLPEAPGDTGRSTFSAAAAYARDAVIGKWKQWALLILATVLILIPLSGYLVRVLRGTDPAPAVSGWVELMKDGIGSLLISIVYFLPSLLLQFVMFALLFRNFTSLLYRTNPTVEVQLLAGFLLSGILSIAAAIFLPVGLIRFSRTRSLGEAFRFGAILASIGKIGWLSYLGSLVLLVIMTIIITNLFLIPYLGFIIEVLIFAPFTLFEARYFCLLYDRAGGE